MFHNPGKKIKVIAQINFWIDFLGSIIGGIILIAEDYANIGIPLLVGSFFVSYLIALLLVGFGELVENSAQPNKKTEKASVVKPAKKQPAKEVEEAIPSCEAESNMIICPHCGIEQSHKNKICWSCDKPLK